MTMARPPRVLLTGFEPFGGAPTNPSWDVADLLARHGIGERGADVAAVRLPVSFARVRPLLAEAMHRHEPDVVVALGLAAGRAHVSIERVGINLAIARIPDNDGAQPRDVRLRPGGPAAHLATLPVGQLLARDARLLDSLSAGAYVCNAALFHLLDLVSHGVPGSGRVRAAGFVHVPATSPKALASHDAIDHGESGAPSVPLAEVVDAVAGIARGTLALTGASQHR